MFNFAKYPIIPFFPQTDKTHILLIMKKKQEFLPILFVTVFILLSACESPVPKPRSFFRIALPEKNYLPLNAAFPYSFEYPGYATIRFDPSPLAEPYWINIDIPHFSANIHLSYKKVNNNLAAYLDDSHRLLTKQISKASGIREDIVENQNEKVFGTVYHVKGPGVASPCQFYVTDSTRHFLRGALYFNVIPNNDSLAPVIDFLKEDIRHLLSTLHWN